MYLYENHLGGLYLSEYKYDIEDLYCETCRDSDSLIGEVYTWKDIINEIGIDNIYVSGYDCGIDKEDVIEVCKELDKSVTDEEIISYLEKVKGIDNIDKILNTHTQGVVCYIYSDGSYIYQDTMFYTNIDNEIHGPFNTVDEAEELIDGCIIWYHD